MTKRTRQYIERLLRYHNILGSCDKVFEDNLGDLLKEFQGKKNLPVTGIFDPDTLWELQYDFVLESSKLRLRKVPADLFLNGFDHFFIREDIEDKYMNVYNEMHEKEAIVPSSGSLRGLTAKVTPGRSSVSFHYSGLALDFLIWSGLQNPEKDPFVVHFDEANQAWTVYAESKVPGFPEKTVEAVYVEKHGLSFQEVSRPLFNFTELMKEHGFSSISPRQYFHVDPKKYYTSAEWWHFQADSVLYDSISQFGIEILKIYDEDRVKKSPVWDKRKMIFHGKAFHLDFDYLKA